jgi:hypothetical protein
VKSVFLTTRGELNEDEKEVLRDGHTWNWPG